MVKNYLTEDVTTAADGVPPLTGRRKRVFSLLKSDTPDIMKVHNIVHRESFAAAWNR